MTDYVADTHALIWYLTDSNQLGPEASAAFDACDAGEAAIFVPTICLVELIYLQEKGRIPAELKAALDTHLASGRTGLYTIDLTLAVVKALSEVSRDLVPDLPDRIVAATAKALNLPLLTRDRDLVARVTDLLHRRFGGDAERMVAELLRLDSERLSRLDTSGRVSWPVDGLTYQQQARDEWG